MASIVRQYGFKILNQLSTNGSKPFIQQARGFYMGPLFVQHKVDPETRDIHLHFNDRTIIKLPLVWFKDACQCPKCYDKDHLFRKLRHPLTSSSLANTPMPEIRIHAGGTKMRLTWKDEAGEEHVSVLDPAPLWLSKTGRTLPDVTIRLKKEINLWSGQNLNESQFPQVNYEEFLANDQSLKDGLKKFRKYGFLKVDSCPKDPNAEVIPKIAKRIAYIRESSFGSVADVYSGPQSAIHPSYRGEELSLHTDLTYREKSPGILALHYLKTADPGTVGEQNAGGKTMLSDGYNAAYELLDTDKEAFDILTRVYVPFSYRDPLSGLVYRAIQPTIKLAPGMKVMAMDIDDVIVHEIHYSNFARQAQLSTGCHDISLERFYEALKKFSDILTRNQVEFYATPGDTLILNNRRVLHGRTSFDAQKAERRMHTCYIDLDEVEAKFDLIDKASKAAKAARDQAKLEEQGMQG